ncbi:MAG: hypothetical protein ABIG32_00195 [Candidatus Uhrbacteria bacterium]
MVKFRYMKKNKPKIYSGSLADRIIEGASFFWEQYRVKTPRGFGWIDIDSNEWLKRNENIKRWKMIRELKRLQARKLAKVRAEGDKVMFTLTQDGQVLMLARALKDKNGSLPKGKQCFIIFDVPESVRYVRREIRYILKDIECEKIQRSVWVTDRDVVDELVRLIKISELEKWVQVIVGQTRI